MIEYEKLVETLKKRADRAAENTPDLQEVQQAGRAAARPQKLSRQMRATKQHKSTPM